MKEGVEAHLQKLFVAHIHFLGDGHSLVRREYVTAIGPVDILAQNADGHPVVVELQRPGDIDGVEQLIRYLSRLNRDTHLALSTGVFAAQESTPWAR